MLAAQSFTGSWAAAASQRSASRFALRVGPVQLPGVVIERRGLGGGADMREAEVGVGGRARPGVLASHHAHLSTRLGVLLVDQRQRQDRPRWVDGGGLVCQACQDRPGFHSLPGVSELELFLRPDPPDNLHDPESPAGCSRGNQHETGTAAGVEPSAHQAVGCP